MPERRKFTVPAVFAIAALLCLLLALYVGAYWWSLSSSSRLGLVGADGWGHPEYPIGQPIAEFVFYPAYRVDRFIRPWRWQAATNICDEEIGKLGDDPLADEFRLLLDSFKQEKPYRMKFVADQPADTVEGKIELFNGENLSGWTTWLVDDRQDNSRHVFGVQDGLLHVTGDGFGYMATEKSYRDYRLVVEYKWGERNWRSRQGKARDSGLFVHCSGPDGNSYDADGAYKAGIECQIMEGATGDVMLIRGGDHAGKDIPLRATANVDERLDAEKWPYWSPDGEPRTLKLWGRVNWRDKDPQWKDELGVRGRRDEESQVGEWTRLECVCAGGRIQVLVNGVQVNEVFDVFPTSGQILLQCEGSEIFFRRVEIHPLED